MAKQLSEQLADLSVRAKSAEQALDAAEKEAHEKVTARKEQAHAAATKAVEKVNQDVKSANEFGDQKLGRREGEDCRRHEPLEGRHRTQEA